MSGAIWGLCMTGAIAPADFLRRCLSIAGDLERKVDGCIQRFLLSIDDKARGAILAAVAKGANADQVVRLFRCAPFGQDTWRLIDQYGEEIRNRYWEDVFPHWNRHSKTELSNSSIACWTQASPRRFPCRGYGLAADRNLATEASPSRRRHNGCRVCGSLQAPCQRHFGGA
jgi:hypothetical protein